jgi:DNA-binding NarL/FixJ family response regulator
MTMREKPFVLIIEDHPLYKQGLESLMRMSFPDANVAAGSVASDAFDFFVGKDAETISRSVILLDLSLPGLSGLELIDQIHTAQPDLQIIVISGSDDPLRVGACLGVGVQAFVSKSTPPDRIVDLIGRALRDRLTEQFWLNAQGPVSIEGVPKVHLTTRQIEVLNLICQGMTNQQIAQTMNIIEATVKAHVSAIFKSLGVVSRTQALLAAQRLGFKEDVTPPN